VKDVKEDVLLYLRKLYANQSPQFIYYLTLFHLSAITSTAPAISTMTSAASRSRTPASGARSSPSRRTAPRPPSTRFSTYNGCILADSVGLGKTYTALAVIKYFELRNERVLVLCPKKLSRNWTIYRNPSSLNPFSDDKFRYDVLHHTDLSRESGRSTAHLDLAQLGRLRPGGHR
jgi:hypothetical protein